MGGAIYDRTNFPVVKTQVSTQFYDGTTPAPVVGTVGYNYIYPREYVTLSGYIRVYTIQCEATVMG